MMKETLELEIVKFGVEDVILMSRLDNDGDANMGEDLG